MNTPQITLADCLTEVKNALNYLHHVKASAGERGASQAEHDAQHVRLFQFRDRLQQQLRQLREAGKDAGFDLAMAMAELASVAKERDNIKSERDGFADVIADYMNARQGLKDERDEARVRADLAGLAADRQSAELEKLKIQHRDAVAGWNKAAIERDKLRDERDSANWSLSRAKESLRASEQEVEEIDTLCNDFRRANSRLVADLAAAMQRADTAEAILRAKA